MDPDTLLLQILAGFYAMESDDTNTVREDTIQALRDLARWLDKDGFPPRARFVRVF